MNSPTATRGARRRLVWRRWRDLPIRSKGLVVVLLPLLIVITDCAALAYLLHAQAEDRDGKQKVYLVQRASAILLLTLVDAETGVRGFLATGDATYLQPYEAAAKQLPAASAALHALTDVPAVAGRLTAIDNLTQQEMAILAQLRGRPQAASRATLQAAGKTAMDSLRSLLADIDAEEQTFAARLDRRVNLNNRLAVVVAVASLPLAFIGGMLAMSLFTSGIGRRTRAVHANAEQLGAGLPLHVPLRGRDELAQLDHALVRTAAILQQRQQDLEDATAHAQAADRAKSAFLSRMSHELRTPLNAIIGFGQLLELETTDVEDQESVHQILKASRHLLELINEVLDLSRIEAGHLTLSLEPVVIDEILADAIGLISPLAQPRNVTITVADPQHYDEHLTVRADRHRLRQVLLNLLSNAVKYNRSGGTVAIAYALHGQDRVRLTVTDDGPGIAEDHLDRLFTPFDRLNADQTGQQGTGLGLPLSKQLIEAMRGGIGIEPAPGHGARFWIELPHVPPTTPAADNDHHPDPVARHATVLCIDDNPANLDLVQRLLSHRPELRFVPARQGRIGVDLAIQQRPDLILLDLHLPDQDGCDVLITLKQFDETRGIPVIVTTADATPRRLNRVLDAGAAACLTKPLDRTLFTTAIDNALQPTQEHRDQH